MKRFLTLTLPIAACAFAIACSTSTNSSPSDSESDTGTDSTGTDDTTEKKDAGKTSSKDSGTKTSDFELAGSWTSSYGATEGGPVTITNTKWTDEYATLTVVSFNNTKNIAIVQNPPADSGPLDPNKFSRNVWIEPKNGVSYYCTEVYGLDTEDEALAATGSADDTDLDGKGCGGAPWTKLTKAE